MLYRMVHAVNASYSLAVAWMYIAGFAAALGLLFIFPQVTLLLFFLGLASLALTISLGWGIDFWARRLALQALHHGRCPRCHRGSQQRIEHEQPWTCEHCHSEFRASGDEVDQVDRARYHDEAELDDDDERLLQPIFTDDDEQAWFDRK
jgi:hypothetical protein